MSTPERCDQIDLAISSIQRNTAYNTQQIKELADKLDNIDMREIIKFNAAISDIKSVLWKAGLILVLTGNLSGELLKNIASNVGSMIVRDVPRGTE